MRGPPSLLSSTRLCAICAKIFDVRGTQFFWIVTAVIVALAIEGVGRIAYRMTYGHGYATQDTRPKGRSISLDELGQSDNDNEALPTWLRREVLHPYLGFVDDGNLANHGFHTDREVLAKRRPGSIAVALLGGSVAIDVSAYVERALEHRLPKGREL